MAHRLLTFWCSSTILRGDLIRGCLHGPCILAYSPLFSLGLYSTPRALNNWELSRMVISETQSTETQSIVVDRMKFEEAEDIASLFGEVLMSLPYYNEQAKASELVKYQATSLRDSAARDPDSVLVARDTSQVVGFCFNHNDDGIIWLSWFGVHPDYRRRGVGAALLTKLESTVREGRSHKIWCDCRTENEASKCALTKQGYTQLVTLLNHWYGQDFIIWEKLV